MDAPKFYQVEFKYERVERFIVGAFDPDDIAPSIQSPPNGQRITGFDPPTVTVLGEVPNASAAAIYLGPRHPNESYCQQVSSEQFSRWSARAGLDIEGLPMEEVSRIRRYVAHRRAIAMSRAKNEAISGSLSERVSRPHQYKGLPDGCCYWCGDDEDDLIHRGEYLPILRAVDA